MLHAQLSLIKCETNFQDYEAHDARATAWLTSSIA